MDKYERLMSQETFFHHPLEDCVIRTKPLTLGFEVYARFHADAEYLPLQTGDLVAQAINQMGTPITREEYYSY